ncbi:hypothetical protein GCM10022232_15390 [Streptomyces plumbiresistens]|uniref:Uncharacterized protein n=1 Tax=Streptomyces plumbiresistens TaxID=511811 RepID=A0ABP7QJW6_9ACTN
MVLKLVRPGGIAVHTEPDTLLIALSVEPDDGITPSRWPCSGPGHPLQRTDDGEPARPAPARLPPWFDDERLRPHPAQTPVGPVRRDASRRRAKRSGTAKGAGCGPPRAAGRRTEADQPCGGKGS